MEVIIKEAIYRYIQKIYHQMRISFQLQTYNLY